MLINTVIGSRWWAYLCVDVIICFVVKRVQCGSKCIDKVSKLFFYLSCYLLVDVVYYLNLCLSHKLNLQVTIVFPPQVFIVLLL